MLQSRRWIRYALAGSAIATAVIASAPAQQSAAPAAAPVKLGIVSFLTGPAASPFGIPGRNGAEVVIEAFNSGKAPPPFDKVGLGGGKIEAKFVDEAGSAANVVTEYRNLVQRDQVDAVIGYVSSGSCLAVTPVAEELKELTVLYDCGTPRIFEEKARTYVFRVSPHATMDNVAAARYLLAKKKNLTSYSGINQNYAWGQDSWRDFVGAMKALAPTVEVDKVLFPKLFAGEYGAEVSTLLTSKSQALHTSFYDGDLEAFVYQEQARGLEGDRGQVEQLAAARAACGGVGQDCVGREQRREQDDVADQEDPEAVGDDDALGCAVSVLLGERGGVGVAADRGQAATGDAPGIGLRAGGHEAGLSVGSAASRAARLARSMLATVAAGIASSCSSRQATTTNTPQAQTKATTTSHQMCQISAKPIVAEKNAQMKPAALLRGMWMSWYSGSGRSAWRSIAACLRTQYASTPSTSGITA